MVSSVEEVPAAEYRLTVEGLPDGPATLTFADLAALPQTTITRDVQCVTGWRVPGRHLVRGAAARTCSTTRGRATTGGAVLFGSFDGAYTESLTLEQALRPDVLIATSMDWRSRSPTTTAARCGCTWRRCTSTSRSSGWTGSRLSDQVVPGYWEERGYDVDAWVGQSNGRSDAPIA